MGDTLAEVHGLIAMTSLVARNGLLGRRGFSRDLKSHGWLVNALNCSSPSHQGGPLRISLWEGSPAAAAAAAAKSLQSCPTLCDPIDSSPPGSPIPGILQARTLEWVAISFSNA